MLVLQQEKKQKKITKINQTEAYLAADQNN